VWRTIAQDQELSEQDIKDLLEAIRGRVSEDDYSAIERRLRGGRDHVQAQPGTQPIPGKAGQPIGVRVDQLRGERPNLTPCVARDQVPSNNVGETPSEERQRAEMERFHATPEGRAAKEALDAAYARWCRANGHDAPAPFPGRPTPGGEPLPTAQDAAAFRARYPGTGAVRIRPSDAPRPPRPAPALAMDATGSFGEELPPALSRPGQREADVRHQWRSHWSGRPWWKFCGSMATAGGTSSAMASTSGKFAILSVAPRGYGWQAGSAINVGHHRWRGQHLLNPLKSSNVRRCPMLAKAQNQAFQHGSVIFLLAVLVPLDAHHDLLGRLPRQGRRSALGRLASANAMRAACLSRRAAA
jgi:hypothetical protein